MINLTPAQYTKICRTPASHLPIWATEYLGGGFGSWSCQSGYNYSRVTGHVVKTLSQNMHLVSSL